MKHLHRLLEFFSRRLTMLAFNTLIYTCICIRTHTHIYTFTHTFSHTNILCSFKEIYKFSSRLLRLFFLGNFFAQVDVLVILCFFLGSIWYRVFQRFSRRYTGSWTCQSEDWGTDILCLQKDPSDNHSRYNVVIVILTCTIQHVSDSLFTSPLSAI